MSEIKGQDYQWSRHAAKYDDLFLDPFQPGVENPLFTALEAIPDGKRRTAVDLGCGTGPLLPRLLAHFGTVVAIDFAPGMIERSKDRLGPEAQSVTFLNRPMHELHDYTGQFDVACAINSLVMPDVREIDQTLAAIRASLKPDGMLLGIVPAIDAIYYQTLLLMDQALDRGQSAEEAERLAAFYGEHRYYNFAFGRFRFRGLKQKFWQPFEIRHRLRKAGFTTVELDQVLYPWDENIPGGAVLRVFPGAGTGCSRPDLEFSPTLNMKERRHAPQATPQARVFTSRTLVEELFESDAPKADWRAIPFSVYLRQTPATPLSGLTKALLWTAAVLVALVLVAAIARHSRALHGPAHRHMDEAISAVEAQ